MDRWTHNKRASGLPQRLFSIAKHIPNSNGLTVHLALDYTEICFAILLKLEEKN